MSANDQAGARLVAWRVAEAVLIAGLAAGGTTFLQAALTSQRVEFLAERVSATEDRLKERITSLQAEIERLRVAVVDHRLSHRPAP